MNGKIIEIGTILKPIENGHCECGVCIKSDENDNCFDVLVWSLGQQPTERDAIDAIIRHMETIKDDIDKYIVSIQNHQRNHELNELNEL